MMAWRRYAAIFALTAILVRAFVPLGWMPSIAQGAAFEVVVCTLSGQKHVAFDANGDPLSDQQKDTGDSAPCAFATAANLAPPASAAPIVFVLSETYLSAAITDIASPRQASRTAWQSRAPPRATSVI
jgi:hypothetical protein